jgi:hypothetical protein
MSTIVEASSQAESTATVDSFIRPSSPRTLPARFLRLKKRVVAKQIEEAIRLMNPNVTNVADVYKINWGSKTYILDGFFNKKKSRGRRSWIADHGWYLTELDSTNKPASEMWTCKLCDEKGKPFFVKTQSTSGAARHLQRYAISGLRNICFLCCIFC